MSQFTSRISYAQQQDVYFDDGRETELLQTIFSLPPAKLTALRNNPAAILSEIDSFATKKYLMNIGELKGKLITTLIKKHRPRTIVELGGYVGYSALLFGSCLRDEWCSVAVAAALPPRYFCIEMNPVFGAVIMALVDLAGLGDVVKVVIGASDAALRRLHGEGELQCVDLLFLDHFKPAYVGDLKLCESLGFIGEGAVVAADNVVKPGNPPYLKYVRMSVGEKREEIKACEGTVKEGVKLVDGRIVASGDPNLIYESKMVESFEPTGIPDAVEITACRGRSQDGLP